MRDCQQNVCFSSHKKLLRPVTMALKPFTRLNFSKLRVLGGCKVLIVGCQEPLVVRMPYY